MTLLIILMVLLVFSLSELERKDRRRQYDYTVDHSVYVSTGDDGCPDISGADGGDCSCDVGDCDSGGGDCGDGE